MLARAYTDLSVVVAPLLLPSSFNICWNNRGHLQAVSALGGYANLSELREVVKGDAYRRSRWTDRVKDYLLRFSSSNYVLFRFPTVCLFSPRVSRPTTSHSSVGRFSLQNYCRRCILVFAYPYDSTPVELWLDRLVTRTFDCQLLWNKGRSVCLTCSFVSKRRQNLSSVRFQPTN